MDFRFYYSHDEKLRNEVFSKFSFQGEKPTGDTIAILRHKSLLDDFDPAELVFYSKFDNLPRLRKFIEFERYPKMRGKEMIPKNIQMLYWKGQYLFLYISG